MATADAPMIEALTGFNRERARAEAREVEAMLDYRDAEVSRTEDTQPPMRRQLERSAIPLTIGEAMGLSEGQVHLRLSAAETLRDNAPRAWSAFALGQIDFSRARDIAGTIDILRRPESRERLDKRVVDFAVGRTGAELRVWLRRFVQRVEADLAAERADSERKQRHVSVTHGEDGMSWLNLYIPSLQAATIESRVRREARRPDAGDTRTVAQREADLLVAWCTNSDATTASIDAHIAVMIDADVLAGAVEGFAQSSDGRWGVPVSWITEMARTGNSFWHRMVLEPVRGDVLSHEYVERFCPEILGLALGFRDGVCQAPGCMVPAARCDMDHREPFPEGPTNAENLGPLCRRHHGFKGHGFLRWSTRPPPPLVTELHPQSVFMEYAA